MFSSLGAGMSFVIVKFVICAHIQRGEVRHNHIGSCQHAFSSALRVERTEGSGCRK